MIFIHRLEKSAQYKKRLKQVAHRLRIRAQGSWIYRKNTLRWITESCYKNQLPLLYRYFATYCQFWIETIPINRIIGARLFFFTVRRLQRQSRLLNSTLFRFPNLEVYLDLEDPRFLAVGSELTGGDIYRILSHFIRDGDTFIDIGANQGAFSFIATKIVDESGAIVSIEPIPQFAANIEKSLKINARCKFQVHQIAVGDTNGIIDFIIPKSYSGTAGVYTEYSGIDGYRKIQVNIRRFDDAINWRDFSGSVFVKLDIEGAELAFLKGAQEMLRTLHPNLLIEINPVSLSASQSTVQDLVVILKNLGYTHYRRLNNFGTLYKIDTLDGVQFQDVIVSHTEKNT